MSTYKKIIKERALYAKELSGIIHNPGLAEDADKVLSFLKYKYFDMHDLLATEAYKSVLRAWNRTDVFRPIR